MILKLIVNFFKSLIEQTAGAAWEWFCRELYGQFAKTFLGSIFDTYILPLIGGVFLILFIYCIIRAIYAEFFQN